MSDTKQSFLDALTKLINPPDDALPEPRRQGEPAHYARDIDLPTPPGAETIAQRDAKVRKWVEQHPSLYPGKWLDKKK